MRYLKIKYHMKLSPNWGTSSNPLKIYARYGIERSRVLTTPAGRLRDRL